MRSVRLAVLALSTALVCAVRSLQHHHRATAARAAPSQTLRR